MIRVVQQGNGQPRAAVVCFLVGSHMDAAMRKALGPDVAILADDTSTGKDTEAELRARIRRDCGAGDVVLGLVGYSAGCQRVRKLLLDGARPAAVATIDGTHASMPPLDWQIKVWQDLAAEARAGRVAWVATCTQQLYVERLKSPDVPFMATRHVLERATGLELLPRTEHRDGGLFVQSFASKDIDADAHIAQQRVALPEALVELGPFLLATAHGAPPGVPDVVTTPKSFGERCVVWSLNEQANGVCEAPPGSNTGVRIREYLRPCLRNGKPLGLTAGAWCAAAACAAMRACVAGESEPHEYVASGLEIEQSATVRGTRRDPKKYRPKIGDVGVLTRGTGWTRHVVRVVEPRAEDCTAIGGNENDRWGTSVLRYDDPRIVCWVEYP